MLTVLLAAALAVLPADFGTARLSWASDLHAKRLKPPSAFMGKTLSLFCRTVNGSTDRRPSNHSLRA